MFPVPHTGIERDQQVATVNALRRALQEVRCAAVDEYGGRGVAQLVGEIRRRVVGGHFERIPVVLICICALSYRNVCTNGQT